MSHKSILTACIILPAITLLLSGCCGGQMNCSPKQIHFDTSRPDVAAMMTFNIRTATVTDLWNHWVFRRQRVCETIAANAPDVFGVQEAKFSQVRDIEKMLPQYASYAAGRLNGKRAGETNAVFFRKDRFELLDSGTFWFSNKPDKPGSGGWGNIYPRICSWVYLREQHTGARFYVYNMHLDVFSQNSRARSIALLTERINARGTSDPFVMMGDFNMEEDNPAMSPLDAMGYRSAEPGKQLAEAVAQGSDIGTRHEFMGSCPRIDHIRLSKGLKGYDLSVDRRKVQGAYPSDHYPVTAMVRFEGVLVAQHPSLDGAKVTGVTSEPLR